MGLVIYSMTYALSLLMQHRPQTAPLHSAATFSFPPAVCQVEPDVHISFSSSLQVFFGHPLPL